MQNANVCVIKKQIIYNCLLKWGTIGLLQDLNY